jgi:GNAT superfamily N-acetyltransferase
MTAPTPAVTVARLDGAGATAAAAELADLLIDAVAGGASVGFVGPLAAGEARRFWDAVARRAGTGATVLLAARHPDGTILGTVQLDLDTFPNQAHRATVGKLLVHTRARRRGVGSLLMAHAEREARAAGRSLLTLDTVEGSDAQRLYERDGWTRAGAIPDYARDGHGALCATVYYWKRLD